MKRIRILSVDFSPSYASLKGGAGSGYFGHAGRPGEVGGSAPAGTEPADGGAQALADEVTSKHGYPTRIVGGVVVAQSTRFASKGKWAVWDTNGMNGNWHDTPQAAVDAWGDAQIKQAKSQADAQIRKSAIAKLENGDGDLSDWRKVAGGSEIISMTRATDILRECGLSLHDAKQMVASQGIVWESGGGGQYINSARLFEKLKKSRSG